MLLKETKVLAIFSIFLVTILFHISTGIEQAEEVPNPKVDYVAKLNELGKAGRAESLNAAPYYEKAFKLYVGWPEQISSSDVKAWPKDLPKEKQILLQDWVSANSDAVEQLKLGAQKPYYWTEYQGSFMAGVAMPELKQARILTYAVCLRAKLNATKGNFKEAFSDLLVCYRFGEHFTGPKTLVEQLVGIGLRAYTVQAAFQILDKGKPNADLLKDFQRQLETLSAGQSHIIDFTFDKFFIYDNIQRMFTDDGKGGGHMFELSATQKDNWPEDLKILLSDLTEEQISDWEKMDRRETTELADKVFEYLSGAVHKTPAQLHKGKEPRKVVEEMTKTNPMLNLLTASFARVLQMSYRGKIETEALITTLGLLRYKADKGRFPATLPWLAATGYIKELPVDPYSDKPLVYKRTEDNFTLYSFGADFDDDVGVRSKWGEGEQGGDGVFWPIQ